MLSETTDETVAPAESPRRPRRGWLLYDRTCPFCTRTAERVRPLLAPRGFAILPLQTPWARRQLGLVGNEPPMEMVVLTTEGRTFGGADAALFLARFYWWAWPVRVIARLPGMRHALRHAYRWIAARRSCAAGACAVKRTPELSHGGPDLPARDFLPLLLLPLAALATFSRLPAWAFMWLFACAIFAGCKWLTWRRAMRRGGVSRLRRSFGYLLAWPGMDATDFLRDEPRAVIPATREWLAACAKTILGAALVWGAVRIAASHSLLLAGWTGMIGLIFLLHFGGFHLLSLAWRAAGVNARPLMRAPILACSLVEFWGRRWNAAFHELVHRFAFRPLARRFGAIGATLGVFTISGVVHDLGISLPARGGFGLPTLYFLIQGAGVLFERTATARRAGLDRGPRARAFTLVVVTAPVACLFHPAFVREVMLPFLHAIGAY